MESFLRIKTTKTNSSCIGLTKFARYFRLVGLQRNRARKSGACRHGGFVNKIHQVLTLFSVLLTCYLDALLWCYCDGLNPEMSGVWRMASNVCWTHGSFRRAAGHRMQIVSAFKRAKRQAGKSSTVLLFSVGSVESVGYHPIEAPSESHNKRSRRKTIKKEYQMCVICYHLAGWHPVDAFRRKESNLSKYKFG